MDAAGIAIDGVAAANPWCLEGSGQVLRRIGQQKTLLHRQLRYLEPLDEQS